MNSNALTAVFVGMLLGVGVLYAKAMKKLDKDHDNNMAKIEADIVVLDEKNAALQEFIDVLDRQIVTAKFYEIIVQEF